jgi:hypothetical protein
MFIFFLEADQYADGEGGEKGEGMGVGKETLYVHPTRS